MAYYIVIEKFPEPSIMTDTEGKTITFDDISDAQHFAETECQNGQAIKLD